MANVFKTEVFYTVDGNTEIKTIHQLIEVKNKNLYLGDDKIADLFNHGANTYQTYIEYNKIDLTDKGRILFDIPDDWNSHMTKIRLYGKS